MILCVSLFQIINTINMVPDQKPFILIAASVADAAAINSNGTKTFLSNGNTFFINGKATLLNGLRKLSNPASWLLIFLVNTLNKFCLCSKDLIILIIYFLSLFVSVIPEAFKKILISENVSKAAAKVLLFSSISKAVFIAETIMSLFLTIFYSLFLFLSF